MIELKILPKFYNDILYKDKRFEVRDTTDRTFRLGDLILLREYYKGEYTDRECIIKIIYILKDPEYCKENTCIFGFELITTNHI